MNAQAARPGEAMPSELRHLDSTPWARPWKRILWEFLMLTAILMVLLVYALTIATDATQTHAEMATQNSAEPPTRLETFVEIAAGLGAVLVNHIGWAFGVFIPTVLGFFILVLGEQWVLRNRAAVSRLRRRLSVGAQLLSASTVLAVVLIGVHSLRTWTDVGVFLLVIPALILLCALSIGLSVFAVPEPQEKLRAAELDREWALGRRELLPSAEWDHQYPVPSMLSNLLLHSLVCGTVATAVLVPQNSWASVAPPLAALTVVALLLALAAGYGRFGWYTARDLTDRIFAVLAPLTAWAAIVTVAVLAVRRDNAQLGWSLLVLLLLTSISAGILPWRRLRGLYAHSLHRAVASTVRTMLDSRIARADETIRAMRRRISHRSRTHHRNPCGSAHCATFPIT